MIIKRNKIIWIIEPTRIIACTRLQATGYTLVGSNKKIDLFAFRDELLSNEVGGDWVEVLTLASKYNLVGVGVLVEKRWFNE